MDKIPVKCTACGKQFLVSASLAGKKAKCLCGSIVVVGTAPADDQQWYYAKDGQRNGPVGADDLRNLAANGQITGEDLVWAQGMAEWEKLSDHPELVSAQPPQEQQAAPAATAEPAPAAAAEEEGWYYAREGKQYGPAPASAIGELLASGELSAADAAWRDGMEDWKQINQIAELAGLAPVQAQAEPEAAGAPAPAEPEPVAEPAPAVQYEAPEQPVEQVQEPVQVQQAAPARVLVKPAQLRSAAGLASVVGVLALLGSLGAGACLAVAKFTESLPKDASTTGRTLEAVGIILAFVSLGAFFFGVGSALSKALLALAGSGAGARR